MTTNMELNTAIILALVAFVAITALIFYTVAVWGLCWTIAGSKASLPFRRLLEYLAAPGSRLRLPVSFLLALVECPACISFHVGWITVLALAPLQGGYLAVAALALGFYNIGAVYILGRLTGFITEE